MSSEGRSFRVAHARGAGGPPRSVIGPGVLAGAFAVLLTLAGTPASLGAAGPGVASAPTPGVSQVARAPARHPAVRAKRPQVARSVLLREDCHH